MNLVVAKLYQPRDESTSDVEQHIIGILNDYGDCPFLNIIHGIA